MRLLHSEAEFHGKLSAVALGMFDGVHIGHQRLIRTAVTLARELNGESIVCTFDRHPLSLLSPERAPESLLTLDENLRKFEQLGADCALVKSFTREFAAVLPEDYLAQLVDELRAKVIVVGENYTFGRGGLGNAGMIQRYAPKYGYRAVVVPPVMDGDRMASSTYVRELRRTGEWEHVRRLMDIEEK